jgi:UDP-N-acetylglucosamine--N-acetylmuramyl-(pentapeptide) pyrophosphoryl-undecaprenol N-acetylglucosamine transferase
MAGGTGGHVFPALAVARELRSQGVDVRWLGTRKGIESRIVPDAGLPISYISVNGLRGKGFKGWLLAPINLSVALVQAMRICSSIKPGVVLGMGGFASGPGGVASWLLRYPLVIQEQNAVAGMTNRLLSRLARRVLEAFPGSFSASVKTEQTGNPVRDDIQSLDAPDVRYHERENNPIRLLVVGGSLGALVLNQVLPKALAKMPESSRPQIWHQTGKGKKENTATDYTALGVDARVDEFIDDMAEAYNWADVVVCRAGALTISELTTVGLASILVPYPHAVDDHQTRNALYLSEAGAARLMLQTELNAEHLSQVLSELVSEGRNTMLSIAKQAYAMSKPDATKRVAQICLEVMHE